MRTSFLDAPTKSATEADAVEATFRREIAGRSKALERECASAVRARLGWSSDSHERAEVARVRGVQGAGIDCDLAMDSRAG